MKKQFIFVKFLLTILVVIGCLNGYCQNSSVSITSTAPDVLLVEEAEQGAAVFHFDFTIYPVQVGAVVRIQVGVSENKGDIKDLMLEVQQGEHGYVLSNGAAITDGKVKLSLPLTRAQFRRFRYCRLFVLDKNGISSNILYVTK